MNSIQKFTQTESCWHLSFLALARDARAQRKLPPPNAANEKAKMEQEASLRKQKEDELKRKRSGRKCKARCGIGNEGNERKCTKSQAE